MSEKKYYRLVVSPKFREEIRTAAALDDNRSMQRFIIDAIRDRVNRIMSTHSVEIGNVLYRPEGVQTQQRPALTYNEGTEYPQPTTPHAPAWPNFPGDRK